MGYSPWGHKELDTTERLIHTHATFLFLESLYLDFFFLLVIRILHYSIMQNDTKFLTVLSPAGSKHISLFILRDNRSEK